METTATQIAPHNWTDGGDKVLILKRINKDGTSHGGFSKWGKPDELNIFVQPEKFVADAECGNGLHGWAWGIGLGYGSEYSIIDDRWLILAAKPEDVIGAVGGEQKVKCRECVKIFDGTFSAAWAMVNSGRHRLIGAVAASHEKTATGISSASSSSGYSSASSSSGDRSASSSSGYRSASSSSGYSSASSSSGYSSASSSSGYRSASSSSGYRSASSSSGYSSASSSSGYSSASSSSGYRSKSASVGDYSNATQVGKSGIAAAIGNCGTVMAGEDGLIIACCWDESANRYRAAIGYVGENGIMPNVAYRLNDKFELEAVS